MKLNCQYSEYWQLIFWDIDTDILFYILRYWIFDFHELLALIKKIYIYLKSFSLHVMHLEYMKVCNFFK